MFVNELRPGLLTSEESVNQSWDALKELCRKATLEEKNTAVWLVNSFALEHLAEVLDKARSEGLMIGDPEPSCDDSVVCIPVAWGPEIEEAAKQKSREESDA